MAYSNYLIAKVQNLLLGSQAYSVPGTVYLALYTSAPSAGGGGTEVSGGGYARVSVVNNNTNWPDVSGAATKTLGVAQSFPIATGNWGTVTHVGIFDASSGGNLLMFGTLDTPVAVTTNDTFTFPLGTAGLEITLT